MAHPAVLYAVEVLTFVPFAVVLAVFFRRLFLRHAIASAFACTFIAMAAVVFVPTALRSYDLLWPVLRVNAEFILTFLIGVPLATALLQRQRSTTSSPA